MQIDWSFLITIVLALLIVGILNRWFVKHTTTTIESSTTTPLVISSPTTVSGYNDIYHAGADSIE